MNRTNEKAAGTLYVVSLPIGNLADITLRAIETLRGADFIIAEDTRTTKRILDRYRIETPFYSSLYQGAERRRVEGIIKLLRTGNDVALVSDAGTPLISDPGYPLVRAAVEEGLRVTPIPGPTAAIAALVASGLPTDRFTFFGPVPRRAGERRFFLERIGDEDKTSIAFASPHRLEETLADIAQILPDRRIVLARELTKVHEEFIRGTAADINERVNEGETKKGECVLAIEPGKKERRDIQTAERIASLLLAEGVSRRVILRVLTSGLGIARNEAYRLIHPSDRAGS